MYNKILSNIKEKPSIVHCITNYVTVNDCANIILASGGSPIMADAVEEVCDIVNISSSLYINIGTLNKKTVNSMLVAGKKANELKKPIIFDPVGAGASDFRNSTCKSLIQDINFSVIRGNLSEIKFLAFGDSKTKGVDASELDKINEDNMESVLKLAKDLAKSLGSVIAITGSIDIVADSNKAYIIKNGHPLMSKVTGTGCMLSALIGSFVGSNNDNILDATVAAVCIMGICGELAYKKLLELDGGTSTYRTLIIDFISKINSDILRSEAKIESK